MKANYIIFFLIFQFIIVIRNKSKQFLFQKEKQKKHFYF